MDYLWGQPTKLDPLKLGAKCSKIDRFPFYSLLSFCVLFNAENIFGL